MTKSEKPYEESDLNVELFSKTPAKMSEYFRSVQHFLSKDYINDDDSFLDIGGAGGNLAYAIKSEVASIKATIIDPDSANIYAGQNSYPEFTFIQGYFPQDIIPGAKFDIISMQALFPQIPNWKEMLLAIRKHARKYINISLTFKLREPTVIDKDVSYVYYLDSGQRIHQVIHNIYEFMNFLCIYEMGVKKIEFYGYHTPYSGHNFRSAPNSEQIKGNIMIEVFSNDADNPIRMGGAVDKAKGNTDYHFYVPEMNIIIDDEEFVLR